jgi:hypothetical protein
MQMPDKKTWLFIGAALILGAAISGVVGYAVWTKADLRTKQAQSEIKTLQDSYTSLNTYYNQQYAQQQYTVPPAQKGSLNQFETNVTSTIAVDWLTKPRLLSSDKVDFFLRNIFVTGAGYGNDVFDVETLVVGTVRDTDGVYSKWSVLNSHIGDEAEMGGATPIIKTLLLSPNQDSIIVLDVGGPTGYSGYMRERGFIVKGAQLGGELASSTLPRFSRELTLPNGKAVAMYGELDGGYSYATCFNCAVGGESNDYKYFTTTREGIRLYKSDTSSFGQGSGLTSAYAFNAFGQGMLYYSILDEKTDLQNIRWSVTNSTTVKYLTQGIAASTGCGGPAPVATDAQLGALREVGTLGNGDKIYAPQDLKNNSLVKIAYDSYFPPYKYEGVDPEELEGKPSLDEFLRIYPIPFFVWKNAYGTWVTHVVENIVPMGECGKPVIYLYPEKETNVSVRLPSKINVTVSDPTYPRGGWNVLAKPDGSLLYKDGETYGSLFWEGTGVDYSTPKTGFIVKDGEVSNFLTKTLPKYGLNPTEAKEFMDFWVPLFKGAPYYRISFLTDDWSKAAPLNVSPAPRTQIRIFMDWSPLAGLIEIPEPTITTPSRNGFTLVEWGGLLRK